MRQLQSNIILKRKTQNNKKSLEKRIEKRTNKGQDIKDWLTCDNINSPGYMDYWKELAQERQIVLDKSLKENIQLKEKVESLEDEVDLLRAEIEHLRELSQQGLKLAAFLEECGIDFDE